MASSVFATGGPRFSFAVSRAANTLVSPAKPETRITRIRQAPQRAQCRKIIAASAGAYAAVDVGHILKRHSGVAPGICGRRKEAERAARRAPRDFASLLQCQIHPHR